MRGATVFSGPRGRFPRTREDAADLRPAGETKLCCGMLCPELRENGGCGCNSGTNLAAVEPDAWLSCTTVEGGL